MKFAFFHYPLYSTVPFVESDTYLQGSTGLEGLLARNGVDLSFNGHAHVYERNAPVYGMTSYITGGGGAGLSSFADADCKPFARYAIGWNSDTGVGSKCGSAARPTSAGQAYHFLLVSVNGNRVTVTPTDSTGRTFDVQSYLIR